MTSLQRDILIQPRRPKRSSTVDEFDTWTQEQGETTEEEMIESFKMIEGEELVKSEVQDDIGGEFSLFPCCKQCENPEKLFVHIKQHHEKDATKCALCGKELSSKSSLDRHLLIHAKWQPYRCSHCNKQFSTNGNMHRHKKTHKGVCKGSKFVKEEHKLHKECGPLKKSKRSLKYGINVNIKTENTTVLPNATSEKRKIDLDETSEIEQSVKKMKSSCKETSEGVSGNDIENKNVTLDVKTYPLSPDSQPDVTQPAYDKTCLEALCNISSSPTKEEFITTLGLKTACRSESRIEQSDAINSQSDSSIRYLRQHKDEPITPECSFNADYTKKQLISKETLGQSHLKNLENLLEASTVTSQIHVGQSDPPFREMAEVPKENVDNIFNNMDRHWLPESPETSTEGNLFESISMLSAEMLKDYKEDSTRPKHSCEHCKKEFKNKIILQKHLIKHNKRKPFKCTICGANLLSKQNATRHVVKVHKKRRMQAKLLIVENLEETPSAGTKTLCEWCGQEFTSSLILEHHKRASTGCLAKPFICLICNKSFSTKNNGKRHQFKHHKDEQADCCIVRNVMAKNNEDKNSLPRIRNSSTSTTPSTSSASTAGDVPQESSVESSLSSESEYADESELSLPKKELDAAQSLIDMFSSLPPHISSGDETVKIQSEIHSSFTQECKNFYAPMTIPVNVQNKPLDLSVHPMDLSSKSNEHIGRFNAHEFKRLPIFPIPIASKDSNGDTGVFRVDKQNCIPSETPLNLVKKKEHNFKDHFNSSLHPPLLFSSNSFESNHSSMEVDDTRQKECNSPKSSTSYECNLCSMSFSTNSNKRRHEKTKHLMHCKVPQSPKISFGFFNTKDKQMTSTPKSVLSKRTKEALITKVSNLKIEQPVDFSISSNSQPLAIISNESENGDLASVSSLINTANSPQLKKYLTADNACDAATNLDEAPAEVKEDQDLHETVDQTVGSKKGSGKHWCSVCQKQFTCKSSFNRHSVIHTKKRDHHCQECKKTFTTKSNRDRHMKKVHRLFLSRDTKKLVSSRKQQKNAIGLVPSESSSETEMDLTLPKELVNSEISQCNKENQRLFMPS